MKISTLHRIFLDCSGVTTDSRTCPANSLFIALKGDSFNGNTFAAKALESGCAYAFVDEPEYAVKGDCRYVIVDDCLKTLQQLANYHRRQLGTRIIGITGTNGKTTTKELIASVLQQSYRILYTQGNLNNHIGVPLTLLRLTPEHELAVIEMGANHPGEIKFLAELAEPDYGIITNVGKAHLEGFGSFEGVIRTKGELYNFLRSREHPLIFRHSDNPYLAELAADMPAITYGEQESADICGQVTGNSPYLTFTWQEKGNNTRHEVATRLIGEYNFANALAAVALGHYFEVPADKIDAGLSGYTPQNNRSQLKETGRNTLIIDAYNANPTSMMAALQNFRNLTAPRKMLILGDMRELGADSAAEHQKVVDYLQASAFDEVRLVGKEFAAASHPFRTYNDAPQLITELANEQPEGYTILIKGSNGIKLNTVVDSL